MRTHDQRNTPRMNDTAMSIVALMVLLTGAPTVHGEDGRPDRAEPTVTYVIPIQYRDAAELAAVLQSHFGTCAVITADSRTNTLLITGTPSCLRRY
jgi:type II secretory pathway component GspD/PulD (secretin)